MKLSFGWVGLGMGIVIAGSAVGAVKLRNERPIVVVNGEKITRARFLNELEQAHGAAVLRRMVREKLVLQQAARTGLLPTPEQVRAEIAEMRDVEPDLDRQLRLQGKTVEELENSLRGRIALSNLIAAEVNLPDAEVKKLWQAHQKKFDRPEGRKVQMVLAKDSEAGEKARRLLADGIPAELAAQNEKMALPGGRGQILLYRRQLPPALEKQLFDLKPNQVSSVMPMGKAFMVAKVVEAVPARQESFEDVKEKLARAAKLRKGKNEPEILQALQKAAKIEFKSDRYKGLADTAIAAADPRVRRVAQAP